MLRRSGFDLVLLDVKMSRMDGCAVLAEMRNDAALREIPVMMISAFDEMANVVTCIQAGAIDYLFKPFNPILMRARLTATLERKRLLDGERARTRELESLSSELEAVQRGSGTIRIGGFARPAVAARTMVSFMQLIQRRSKANSMPSRRG